ncbi:telomerase reverse transcriptase [Paecilomyces variotii No. 5]|uniref:Telomerase reverse transcriptase n=1 Tax=Byssochlamys spectabilis (strain No. 5 / NBRC 109023) TaxID=1356009 RepID=V5I471_BYSSN|nr:telomerase reverse transcriptase [Paecilomyces variotii No. 5]
MGKKRKRPARQTETPSKRVQVASKPSRENETTHPVISRYYLRVLTLRQYLLEQLPPSSKSRRRRVASLGRQGGDEENIEALATLLDSTLVGILRETNRKNDQERQKDFAAFTQSQYKSSLTSTDTGPTCPQSEIVDFVILTLFNRVSFSHHKPQHILAHGYQRTTTHNIDSTELGALASSIPGIVARYPNPSVSALKRAPWTAVLGLLGENGEEIMLRLLLDCGIFSCMNPENGAFYQFSGTPLSELELDPKHAGEPCLGNERNSNRVSVLRKPNSIIFCRRRMLYARAALNAQCHVRFGLKHTHVLNRFPLAELNHTVHVMKYIFPRQFGLHNVFTSSVDSRKTSFPFMDYTSREEEIDWIEGRKARHRDASATSEEVKPIEHERRPKIPKRLRGKALELVQKLQKGNQRCSYTELLNHYCPIQESYPSCFPPMPSHDLSSQTSEQLVTQPNCPSSSAGSKDTHMSVESSLESPSQSNVDADHKNRKLRLTDYATPSSSVSAFCRAVLQKLIPNEFYGIGQDGQWNRRLILKNVDRFVRLRRFESLSLHQTCMGLKISCMRWAECRTQQEDPRFTQQKLSLTELQKRTELLHELVYYIFDSLLIPIIKAHFYVTESQMHRNRLFYFRHDIWRMLSADPLAHLKSSMLEEMKREKAERILARRSLGYGTLRLLPKSSGARPIVNLRRRTVKKRMGRQALLAPSINSVLAPVSSVLNYEKSTRPGIFRAGMNSVAEMLPRLKAFKYNFNRQIQSDGSGKKHLYFAKLDIQSCFDTIPQGSLIALIEEIVSEQEYCMTKQVEIKPARGDQRSKPSKRFGARAAPLRDPTASRGAGKSIKSSSVLVDTGTLKEHNKDDLLDLLEEHVRRNIIKIGKRYFRQKNGIPQGSVLSSILCNFFYGKLEQEVLGFLSCREAVLLRLIDDFLLITWDPNLAMRFLEVMVRGQPDYGVTVNPEKSVANFEATIDGILIPRLVGSKFAYCGVLIDTRTLEIQRDRDRLFSTGDPAASVIADSLTIEASRAPGDAFNKKILEAFPFVFRNTFIDTAHNSLPVVLSNLYATFADWAMRMYQYLKNLSKRTRPSSMVIIRTIRDVITLATKLIQKKRLNPSTQQDTKREAVCSIKRLQIEYLAAAAFRFVLGRKQTQFPEALHWLELIGKSSRPTVDREAVLLRKAVKNGEKIFEGWRF